MGNNINNAVSYQSAFFKDKRRGEKAAQRWHNGTGQCMQIAAL